MSLPSQTQRGRAGAFLDALDGVFSRARADRAAARLLGGPAAGAVGRDAARVDGRSRRRSRHHRTTVARGPALHHQVHLGAGGRCARRAVAVAAARAAARLAGRIAAAADGGDRLSRHARSDRGTAGGGARCAAGRLRVGHAGHRHRRLPRGKPGRRRAGGRHGRIRRRLPHRHAGVGRGRHRVERLAGSAGREQGRSLAHRLWRGGGPRAGRAVRRARRTRAGRPRGSIRGGNKIGRTDARVPDCPGCVRRLPVARCRHRRSGVRRALQALRCACRNDDGAVRAVARLRQGHIRRHRQGRRAGGSAGRRICRRRRRARHAARHARCGWGRSCRWYRTWPSCGSTSSPWARGR